MKMKNIYICYTLYHLLISLCKRDLYGKIIILTTRINNYAIYKRRIEKLFPEIPVLIVDDSDYSKKYKLFYPKRIKQELFSITNGNKIHIYNDYTQLGYFFHRNAIPYHLMEDGYNSLKHPTSIAPDGLCDKIKGKITNTPRYQGFSKYCKTIEVSSLKDLPTDERMSKFIEKPKDGLFSDLDNKTKESILKIFDIASIDIEIASPSALILTQPLEEHFKSQEEIYQFYKSIVEEYIDKGYHIYIKVHPRDNIDYSNLNATVIQRNIPIELFDFLENIKFDVGITYFSTALDFLNCVNKKIFLYNIKDIK
ncbi:glycosyltransferase family 52 [Streptococcus agalactiae]|uniref:glycosyltransferase family 52 n=1 Tax=Streptococcus agalactiae TaxID=1311 RepID=UPI00042A1920|nr:glycosyltransferase family 52 [Streptococcus agalactiae]